MSRSVRSITWADPGGEAVPGEVISGFRVERSLGSGSLGTVYEATQLSLGRTVALRLIDRGLLADPDFSSRFETQQRLAAAIHHPHIVPTYEAGGWGAGKFVATRFVRGSSLAALLREGSLSAARVEEILAPISRALAVAHAAGLVHGRVTTDNVLVDAAGTAYLADLGLGRPGNADADRAALAGLATGAAGRPSRRRRRHVSAALLAAGTVAMAIAATAVLSGDDPGAGPAPPAPAGTIAVGSELAPGDSGSLGCSADPGPNTPACTLSQVKLAGAPATVAESGVIRSWAVRGATGGVALQVIGRRGERTFLRGFSQIEQVPDSGTHSFPVNVRIDRGDRIGVLLTPGAAIGTREPAAGAAAFRWEGGLDFAPVVHAEELIERELLVRADVELGARPALPQLTGSEADAAPAGEVLGEDDVQPAGGGTVRVALVRTKGSIALDGFRGGRRLIRAAVPDAEPSGQLLSLDADCGYRDGFCLRWGNDGELTPVIHAYRLIRGGRTLVPIG